MAKSGPEILLVRHGETEWSLSGQHTGRTDIPLTDNGRHQGELLRDRLAGRRFARVLSSPLSRALETCRLAGYADEAETRDELLEWDYGVYEGETTADIRKTVPGWTVWSHGSPEGESAADVGARVDTLVAELRELEEDAVVFAHGHLLRVLGARWIGLPPEGGACLAMGTASVSVLGRERETPVIWLWNGSGHLDRGAESQS
jgi:probable phosphoglycerate mutase